MNESTRCISTTSQMRPCKRSALFTVAGRPLCDLHVAESARIIGESAVPLPVMSEKQGSPGDVA